MLAGKKIAPVQKSAQGGNKQNESDTQNSAPSQEGETRDELAKIAGVSHDTMGIAKKPPLKFQGQPENVLYSITASSC